MIFAILSAAALLVHLSTAAPRRMTRKGRPSELKPSHQTYTLLQAGVWAFNVHDPSKSDSWKNACVHTTV